jgi:hypothetical protein
MESEPIAAEPRKTVLRPEARPVAPFADILDMTWPETGLQTSSRVSQRPRDTLSEDDVVELEIDFVRLSLTPLEFIQLASFLRMTATSGGAALPGHRCQSQPLPPGCTPWCRTSWPCRGRTWAE